MGGFAQPQQMSVNPMGQAQRPLANLMTAQMFNRAQQGPGQGPNPFAWLNNPMSQMYNPSAPGQGAMNLFGPQGGGGFGSDMGAPGGSSVFGGQGMGGGGGFDFGNDLGGGGGAFGGGGAGMMGGGGAGMFGGGMPMSQMTPPGGGPMPGGGGAQMFSGGMANAQAPIPGTPPGPNAFQNNNNPQFNTLPGGAGGPVAQAAQSLMGGGQNPFGSEAGIGNFDLAQWGGPFSAPLSPMQMQAMQGAMNVAQNNPFVNNQQMQQAIAGGMGGNAIFDPATQGNIGNVLGDFDTASLADPFFQQLMGGDASGFFGGQGAGVVTGGLGGEGAGTMGQTNDIMNQITPDLISSFQTALNPAGPPAGQAQGLFDSAMDRAAAVAREEASGLGLRAGASDRAGIIGRNVADIAASLAPQIQNANTMAIGQGQNARIGALNAAASLPALLNMGFQNRLAGERNVLGQQQNLLGFLGQQGGAVGDLLNREDRGFNRFFNVSEPAAQRRQQTLGMLPEFRGIPMQEMGQLFGMGEAARGVADQDLARRQQEFARTQGGGLQQMLSLLGGMPLQNTGFGPSTLSQLGQLFGGAGAMAGGAGEMAGSAMAGGFG